MYHCHISLEDQHQGLDRNSAQDRVLRLVIGLGEVGRISEHSYPWRCKLTEGWKRCPRILPRLTLAQRPGVRQSAVSGWRAVVRDEAPHAPGAGGTARGRGDPAGVGAAAAAGRAGTGGRPQHPARWVCGGAGGGATPGSRGVPDDPGRDALAAPVGGGDASDHHPARRRRGAPGV